MNHRTWRLVLLAALLFSCGGAQNTPKNALSTEGLSTVEDGEALIESEEFERAAAVFEGIVQNSPNDPRGFYYLGLCKKRMGDLDGAITNYEKAVSLSPKLMDAHINLGLALLDKGDLGRAESELKIYLDDSPEAPDAHYNYALVLQTKGDLSGAEAHYQKAASLDPADPDPVFGLGETYLAMKKPKEACGKFLSLLDMQPPDLSGAVEGGKLISDVDKACATKLYRGVLEKDDTFASGHFYLGNALAREKSFAEAAEHFRKFLSLAPNDPAAPEAEKRLDACLAAAKQ